MTVSSSVKALASDDERPRSDADSGPVRIGSTPTLLDVIRAAAGADGSRVVFRIIDRGGSEVYALRADEVAGTAARIEKFLIGACGLSPGDHVLLAYPASPDVVVAFLGCLFAGIIPVLAPLPDLDQGDADLRAFSAVAKHTAAAAILSNQAFVEAIRPTGVRRLLGRSPRGWPRLPWHCTDAAPPLSGEDAAGGRAHRPDISDVAFYQVESASPLQVGKIDHRSLMRQLRRQCARSSPAREPLTVRLADLSSFRALHKLLYALYIDSRLHAPPLLAERRRRRRPSWDFDSMEISADGSGPVSLAGVPLGPAALIDSGPVSLASSEAPRRARPTTGSQPVFTARRRTVTGDIEAWKRRLKGD